MKSIDELAENYLVYFMVAPRTYEVKIGRSMGKRLLRREAQGKVFIPDIQTVGIIFCESEDQVKDLETSLQNIFGRTHGEFVNISKELISFVKQETEDPTPMLEYGLLIKREKGRKALAKKRLDPEVKKRERDSWRSKEGKKRNKERMRKKRAQDPSFQQKQNAKYKQKYASDPEYREKQKTRSRDFFRNKNKSNTSSKTRKNQKNNKDQLWIKF